MFSLVCNDVQLQILVFRMSPLDLHEQQVLFHTAAMLRCLESRNGQRAPFACHASGSIKKKMKKKDKEEKKSVFASAE